VLDRSDGAWYGAGMRRITRVVLPGVPHHTTQRVEYYVPANLPEDDPSYDALRESLALHTELKIKWPA